MWKPFAKKKTATQIELEAAQDRDRRADETLARAEAIEREALRVKVRIRALEKVAAAAKAKEENCPACNQTLLARSQPVKCGDCKHYAGVIQDPHMFVTTDKKWDACSLLGAKWENDVRTGEIKCKRWGWCWQHNKNLDCKHWEAK